MKFGLSVPNFGAFGSAHTLMSLAQDAEKAGWDGFFIWDHINRAWKADVVDPWIALAAIATATERITIGALVTPIPRRRPWKLAREVISVDHLSNGRLVFAVGIGSSGGLDAEWANFGEETDLKTRAKMLDEGLDILTGLWSGETFSYEGEFYQVKQTQFLPKPVSKIPIWVGGYWPNKPPFRRAARWDGVIPLGRDGLATPDDIRAAVAYTMEHRTTDAPFDVVHINPPVDSELTRSYADAGATWWLEEIIPQHFGGDWESAWPVEAMHRRIQSEPPRFE
jgi:alkanesulfonate monooxygenase SsuD/methylene tetrahydromethanopterin reductase-like flavin-dependent oxidoreductase (luciferase family)